MVFQALAGVICLSALITAVSTDIVRSAFALLGTFGGVAGLYAFMGADFLMATQLLIYVGGILVLILFAVLLTHKLQAGEATNRSVGLPQGALISLILVGLISRVAIATDWPKGPADATPNPTAARIGDAFLTDYLLPFELASVVLLVALIGAVILARREVRGDGSDEAGAV
jgi:NADH-quinone oxidoreductase subunit J